MIKIFESSTELQAFIHNAKQKDLSVGFVPTMGALHLGHMSLIKRARKENQLVICSIFVNPTQFNNQEDLEKYPRNTQKDARLLEEHGCDAIFLPSIGEMYPKGLETKTIKYGSLVKTMEGPSRPGHFDGVITIVSKLFEIVSPNKAYFGEKDFQQLAIIRAMCKQFEYDHIQIVGCSIIRETSGLAMSSRNQRLSEENKVKAAFIYQMLCKAKKMYQEQLDVHEIQISIELAFKEHTDLTLEYFEIAHEDDLSFTKKFDTKRPSRAFIVAHLQGVRLIDNMALNKT